MHTHDPILIRAFLKAGSQPNVSSFPIMAISSLPKASATTHELLNCKPVSPAQISLRNARPTPLAAS